MDSILCRYVYTGPRGYPGITGPPGTCIQVVTAHSSIVIMCSSQGPLWEGLPTYAGEEMTVPALQELCYSTAAWLLDHSTTSMGVATTTSAYQKIHST